MRTLFQFFQRWSDTDYNFISSHIRQFLDNCFNGDSIRDLDDLFQYFDKNKGKDELKRFLRLLSDELRLRFREDPDLLATVRGQRACFRYSGGNKQLRNQFSQIQSEFPLSP